MNDKEIIELYCKNIGEDGLLEFINKPSNIETVEGDKLVLQRSKYDFINWFRKMTNTEVYRKEILFKFKAAYQKEENE